MKKIAKQLETTEKLSFELEPLQNLPILNKTQIQKLTEIKGELASAFKKLELGRPKYLMEVSVLKDMKFPTPDAKYWQCILERNIQFQNLLFEALDFQEKLAELEEVEAEIEEIESNHTHHNNRKVNAQLMKLDVQRKRILLQMLMLKKHAQERYREIMAWTDLIKELKTQLKYGEDNPEEHMPESFLLRFAHQKRIIEQIGAVDMDGAMNIIGLGQTAARYWKEKREKIR